MIAGDDDDIQMRNAALGGGEKIIELFLRGGGRIGVIENIPGNQQRLNLFGFEGIQQPVQKAVVFIIPLKLMQGLAEMPVRSVQ